MARQKAARKNGKNASSTNGASLGFETTLWVGRNRQTKFAYFVHRKAKHDVKATFKKKAAGPYDPGTRFKGPEGIAIKNGYVEQTRSGKLTGFVSGEKVADIDKYVGRYDFADAVEWVGEQFHFEKNDELELLSTVDFAAQDLLKQGKSVGLAAIRNFIATEPKWAPKLDRKLFSDDNIRRASKELAGHFPETYS